MRLWSAPLRTLRITQAMSGRLKVLIISGQQTSTVMISPGLRFVKRVLPTIDEINPVSRNTNIAAASDSHPIVFFDGVCGLCNHTVNWLLAKDPEHRLRFAPLQGTTAERLLKSEIRDRLDTLVFIRDGRTFHPIRGGEPHVDDSWRSLEGTRRTDLDRFHGRFGISDIASSLDCGIVCSGNTNPVVCQHRRNEPCFWIKRPCLFAAVRSVTFVVERAGESSFLRPSCCGVTPWLIFLSNSSPESLFVWPAMDCRRATKASTRLSPGGSPLLALVNASGPQIEVRNCCPCRFIFPFSTGFPFSTSCF